MRISFQLNAASPLQIKDFFRKLEVPVELTVQGTYRGETHYYFHRPEHSTTSFVISDDMLVTDAIVSVAVLTRASAS